jgi:hypothetical protein
MGKREFITQPIKQFFKSFWKNSLLGLHSTLIKSQFITVGINSSICNGAEKLALKRHDPDKIVTNLINIYNQIIAYE